MRVFPIRCLLDSLAEEPGFPGPPRERIGSDACNGIGVLDNRAVKGPVEAAHVRLMKSFRLVDKS
jgi:hypothetical protein